MTFTDPTVVVCAVCGTPTRVLLPERSVAFGSPDLDTRPPGGARRTGLARLVQRCTGCGLGARDLSAPPDDARDGIADPEYREVLDDASLPAKAREFLCSARLAWAAGRVDDGFWDTLSAAWTSDDAQAADAADRCRGFALAALRLARASGRPVGDHDGIDDVIEADLLRRTGAFGDAERCIRRALDRRHDDVVEQVLRFERDLVGQQDRGVHRVSEALNASD